MKSNLKGVIKHNVNIQKSIKSVWRNHTRKIKALQGSGDKEARLEVWKQTTELMEAYLKDFIPEKNRKFWNLNWTKEILRYEMRLLHIAHSLMKGRSYEKIERPKEENRLGEHEWKLINEYISKYSIKEEVVE